MEDYKKKYEQALERARTMIKVAANQDEAIGFANIIFPELKESEDEKIRKALLNEFIHLQSKGYKFAGLEGEEIIAWLEKQVTPQTRTGSEWVRTIDDACEHRYAEEYAHGEYCHQQSFRWGFQEGVDWLEKQGEQKTIDKVEPKQELKFKTGTYVVYLNDTYMLENDGKHYILTAVKKNTSTRVVHIPYGNEDYTMREWNIADAKDGDVLSDGTTIFIFKDLLSDGSVMSYCDYDTNGGESDAFCPLSVNLMCSKIAPATKEQCDLLFEKMKEAGYMWDAEKKELKKISQEYPLSSDECIKPAWSEEDEEMFKSLKILLNDASCYSCTEGVDKILSWLKSLKERMKGE